MLTGRERMVKAMNFEPTDRAPMDLWKLYGILMLRKDEFDKMNERFDFDVVRPPFKAGEARKAKGTYCEVGEYVDAWGSVWHVGERGVCGEVKVPMFQDWSGLDSYKPPYEINTEADWDVVNRFCGETDKYVNAGAGANPFERLQYLRGTENVYMDLAYGTKEISKLLEMIHDYNLKAVTDWANTDVDGVQIMDDWGSQQSLLISPEMWREIFKPLYKEYCDILRSKGKYILFHSDGFIEPLYPDFIEIGVHAINSQLFCMNMEEIGEKHGGKIVFYGEIDRQNILPFGTVEECRAAVRRFKKAFGHVEGGVVAECCWGLKDPYENIEAVYDEWQNGE